MIRLRFLRLSWILAAGVLGASAIFSSRDARAKESPYRYDSCGEYWVTGKLTQAKSGFELLVFPGTQNQIRLKLGADEADHLWMRVGKTIQILGELKQRIRDQEGRFFVKRVELVTRDPLNLVKGEGFQLIRRTYCQK